MSGFNPDPMADFLCNYISGSQFSHLYDGDNNSNMPLGDAMMIQSQRACLGASVLHFDTFTCRCHPRTWLSPGEQAFLDVVHIPSMLAGWGSGPELPVGAPRVCTVSLEREIEMPLS